MKITFLGAAQTVTGSKYLLHNSSGQLLVDCGLFQGLKNLRLKNWEALSVSPASLNAVVLTHAHLDHSGYLPLLVKNGFTKKIHCTMATKELCDILLPDSGYLQEEEAAYANKHGFSRHHPALPLYTEEDAKRTASYFQPHQYHEIFSPMPDVECELFRAGHILGSSIVRLSWRGKRIVFSGDLGRANDALMRPPEVPSGAETIVVESTYGNRRHAVQNPQDVIADVVNRAVKRRGVVVVPSFAVGRTQLFLYHLKKLKDEKRIPDIPIYLSSPMAIDATNVFRRYPDEHVLSAEGCAEVCQTAQFTRSMEESYRLNFLNEPAVIISASGMATGGRVLHHLKAYAPDPKNFILLIGYQAAGTRGQALMQGAESIKIHGEYVPVKAEIVTMDNLSAHADYEEILSWLSGIREKPKRIFVTHGEPAAADHLRRLIEERLKVPAIVPEPLSSFEL